MGIHRNPGLNQSVLQMVDQYATDVTNKGISRAFVAKETPMGAVILATPRFNQNSYVNRQLNYLTISGNQLVTENVTCNGVKAKALIDTGAAVTAVSDKFARYLPESIQQWNGPNVRLADGQIIIPKQGIEIEIGIHNGEAIGQ